MSIQDFLSQKTSDCRNILNSQPKKVLYAMNFRRKGFAMDVSLADGIEWVGHIDWTIRDFHGYATRRGSSYNAYLIRDAKTTLIDTVKAPYADHLLEGI